MDLAFLIVRLRPPLRMPAITTKKIRTAREKRLDDIRQEKLQNASAKAGPPADAAQYFALLAQATDDALRDWNLSAGTITWACGLEHLLAHEASDATGQIGFWFSHVHPDDIQRVQHSLDEAINGDSNRWMGEYRFLRGDGEYLQILERALICRDREGKALRLIGSMMDVTARRQLQAEFCRSQRMEAFGQLAGGVAHDFNNVLTAILGYSDLLLQEPDLRIRLAEHVRQIHEAASRGVGLTNQLLAFSRRQSLETTVVEINRVITNLERSLLPLLGENISVICNLHELKEGAHVKVDAGQLTQIILNLAVNARDAMAQGGQVTIETSVVTIDHNTAGGRSAGPGEYVCIAVRDTGSGMTDEVKARLFEPFFTTKSKRERSGLGLAVTYGIVRQSGGEIRVETELGSGTTVRIFLPRVTAPAYQKPSFRDNHRGSETILVLEDDTAVRHLSLRVLRKLGYRVLEAARGEEARRLILTEREQRVDLLLADMVMPDTSGRSFADWLRQASPETKVIFISGYMEESLPPGERPRPGRFFLPKPFTADQLAEKVRQVLNS